MKKFSRLLSLALSLVLAASAMGGTSAFALDEEGSYTDTNGNTYDYIKLTSSKAAIVGYSPAKDGSSVTIPSRVGPLTVTQIGDGSAVFGDDIKSITLPKEVVTIADRAFEGSGLTSISLPADLTSIGESAFADSEALASATIPAGVKQVPKKAFYRCAKLGSISFGSKTTVIGDSAFFGCENLKTLTIPEGMRTIGKEAFAECTSLTSVTIPGSVSTIGSDAFTYDLNDDDKPLGANPDMEIKGYSSTEAQRYATKNKIYFTSLGTYKSNSGGSGGGGTQAMTASTNSVTVAVGNMANVSIIGPSAGVSVACDDTAVAKVTTSGAEIFVSGVSAGNATITVTASGYEEIAIGVTVTPPAPGSYPFVLDTTAPLIMSVGQTYYIKAVTNAVNPPTAESSAPSVATVKWIAQKPEGNIYEVKSIGGGHADLTFTSQGQTSVVSVDVSPYASGRVICDTTVNFSRKVGQSYTFKMTVQDTFAKPSFTVGNSAVLKTYAQKKVGNDYYFQIIAVGKPGESTGIYTTLPGQPSVKHCVVFIAP